MPYFYQHHDIIQNAINQSYSIANFKRIQSLHGFVYILSVKHMASRVKIGKSTGTLHTLRERYRTYFPDGVHIDAVLVNNCHSLEISTHRKFGEHRIAGEWFKSIHTQNYLDYLKSMTIDGSLLQFDDLVKYNTV